MRPPGRWHRRGKRACLVGAVVSAVVMVTTFRGLFWAQVGQAAGPTTNAREAWLCGVTVQHGSISVVYITSADGQKVWKVTSPPTIEAGLQWRAWVGARSSTYRPPWSWRDVLPNTFKHRTMFAANLPAAFVAGVCITAVAFFHRRDRRWRRHTSNICPNCKYPLTGLKPDAPCPECGAKHAATTPEALPPSSE